jgi:hypothetical protein
MTLPAAIPEFLAAVATRLRRTQARRVALAVLAVVVVLLVVAPVAAGWLSELVAVHVRDALLLALLVAGTVYAVFGQLLPRRRWRQREEVARVVGRAHPEVASDLLSAVQLETEVANGPVRFSPELAVALGEATAARVAPLDPARVVPGRHALALRVLAGTVVIHGLAVALAWPLWKRGWALLADPPDPAVAAQVPTSVAESLVGDLRITLHYPTYMRREPLVIPVSSGDLVAPRGTRIELSTTALRPLSGARLVFDGATPDQPIDSVALSVDGLLVAGSFVVDKAAAFRFQLERPGARPLVEAEPHRVEIEPDHAPQVELIAPAEELDVSSRRRVELAYSVEDDHGIAEMALVWRGVGGKIERKPLPMPSGRLRTAQGKFYWDLNDAALTPGSRIAYHLEAKDNDSAYGPNIGTSKIFYLRVFSPRERHEDILARQQALLEQLLGHLGDRLERPEDELARHRDLHAAGERLLVELGALTTLLDQDTLAPKGLDAELGQMHQRFDKLMRAEQALLIDLEQQQLRRPGAKVPLPDHDKKVVTELERDALMFDDWIGRQQVEEMLAISDELKQHRERLKELLEKYDRNPSAELRQEIEREMRAIEQRMAELQEKASKLSSEVADRFMNADAMETAENEDCFAEVRRLLDANQTKAAAAKLEECSKQADEAMSSLEDSLEGLRGDRFSAQEKAFQELMGEVADLEQAQQNLAREADDITRRYKEKAAQAAGAQKQAEKEQAKRTLDKLKKQAGQIPREGLTPFSQEEHEAVMKRLQNTEEMLGDGDVPEALAMAKQAQEGLEAMSGDLEDDIQDGQPWSDKTGDALDQTAESRPLAEQLVEDLESAMPSPDQMMTPEDRQKLAELRRRQKALSEKTKRLGEKAQKQKGELPGQAGDAMKQGLDEAGEMMGRGEERFGDADPVGGRDQAEKAAERLGKIGKEAQRAARPSQGRSAQNNEPVKIPGSDQYKPPQEFREDILDAMKKDKAPRQYEDQVKRYYEELVK